MIRRVQASNFKSLGENVDLELGPLTVLVGANASGKSNVADVLHFVAHCLHRGLDVAMADRHGFGSLVRSTGDPAHEIAIRVEVANAEGSGFWAFVLAAGESGRGHRVVREWGEWHQLPGETEAHLKELFADPPDGLGDFFKEVTKVLDRFGGVPPGTVSADMPPSGSGVPEPLAELMEQSRHNAFELREGVWQAGKASKGIAPHVQRSSLALPLMGGDERFKGLVDELENVVVYRIFPDVLREPQKADPTWPMRASGSNWASILRDLDKATAGADLLAALGRITGDIDDYRVTEVGGYLIPELRHARPGKAPIWLGVAQESDGTLRLAGLLTALLQEPPLTLLGIEEPELTVHPGALGVLFDSLRQTSVRSQILLTTHSSDLLDLLDIDAIRVVERRDGVTAVSPVEEAQRSLVKKRLVTTGELVWSEGLRGATEAPNGA
jgi:predicted ATPase